MKALAEERERQLLEAEWRKEVNQNEASAGDAEKVGFSKLIFIYLFV